MPTVEPFGASNEDFLTQTLSRLFRVCKHAEFDPFSPSPKPTIIQSRQELNIYMTFFTCRHNLLPREV